MDLDTIKNNFIGRHNLVRQANIADDTQIGFLDSAVLELFQDEVSEFFKADYLTILSTASASGMVIKQCSDLNVKQRQAIDAAFTPSSDPFNFALVAPAKDAANQVLIDSMKSLLKFASPVVDDVLDR